MPAYYYCSSKEKSIGTDTFAVDVVLNPAVSAHRMLASQYPVVIEADMGIVPGGSVHRAGNPELFLVHVVDGRYAVRYKVEADYMDVFRERALAISKEMHAAEVSGGCMVDIGGNGVRMDARPQDVMNIHGVQLLLESTGGTGAVLRSFDNQEHMLTLDQIRGVVVDLLGFGSACYTRKWERDNLIKAAASLAEIETVVGDFGGAAYL